jgi:tRNA-specific 2-thiouridylase
VLVEEEANGQRKQKQIGEHKGLPIYTIGQRKGVEVGGTGPYYAADMSYPQNILYVVKNFNDSMLMSEKLFSIDNSFVSDKEVVNNLKCQAVIRYRHHAVDCIVSKAKHPKTNKITNNKNKREQVFETKFSETQRAVTAGQSVVWYAGDQLLGGGRVSKSIF